MRLCLCYHAVSPSWPAPLSVTPGALRSQLSELVGRGFRGVTFTELVRATGGEKLLAVTFDDSYRSVGALARPILDELALPGTVFVPTAFADREVPMAWPGIDQWLSSEHRDELIPMSWGELAGLADAGWEIGSHTRTHPKLTRVSDDELAAELSGSKQDLERALGRPCTSLAYPYGDHDDRVVAAADRAGYDTAGTLPKGFGGASALRWPRVGVYHADDSRRFGLKVSPAILALRRTPLWKVMPGGG